MKNVTLLFLILCSFACSDPYRPIEEYTFDLLRSDSHTFSAVVSWGVNSIQYTDGVNQNLYASSFELSGPDRFIISVQSESVLNLEFYRDSKLIKVVSVSPGQTYQFDKNLSQL